MLLDPIYLYAVLISCFAVIVIVKLTVQSRVFPRLTDHQKVIFHVKATLACLGAFIIVLYFLLPLEAVMRASDFPKTVDDIESPKQLLLYLQDQSKATTQTIIVIRMFFLMCIIMSFMLSAQLSAILTKFTADEKEIPDGKD